MAIKPKDQQALDELYAQWKGKFAGVKEDYFALLYLQKRFKIDIEEFAHQVAFHGNDYGLDAYYLDRDAHNLYLFQFKWSENHSLFKESMVRLAEDGIARIFGNPQQDRQQNDLLSYLKKDMNEAREQIDRIYIHFVFKGDVDAAEDNEGLGNRREDLANKFHLIDSYFGREIECQIDYISDRPGKKGPPPSQSYELTLAQHIEIEHSGIRMYLGFVPLSELHLIYISLREQFFDRNIRGALSEDNAPNKKIRDALDRIVLKEVDEPSVFPFRHNGVTLAAEKVTLLDGRVRLHVPRLLNGAQTVSSTARFLEKQFDNPLLKQNKDRFQSIVVIAKIIMDDPGSNFVTEVTISNNQQNPVPAWALRAMDRRQVDLADKFREDLHIFYSRQEGVFDSLSDEERQELGIEDSRDINIRALAQTFLAVQGDVYNMGHLPDVFVSQQLYEKTFKTTYNNVDCRAILLGYKVGLMIRRATNRLQEIVPAKHKEAVPRARNLVWALLIQALMNDKKYPQYLELYGQNLRKDGAFGEVLQQLTSSRIWPILKALFASSTYKDKVHDQKYDFLRTSEVYKKAMADIAYEDFSWERRSF